MLSASNDPQPPFRLCPSEYPFDAPFDGVPVTPRVGAVQGTQDHGGVVDVRVVVVAILKRPAAGAHARPRLRPVADVSNLPLCDPVERTSDVRRRARAAASINAWPASAVSQNGDRQGWQ